MEPNKILSADFLDILFEGKNKEYGAYELRKSYNKRITIAIISIAFLSLLFFLTRLLANDNDKEKNKITVTDVKLESLKKPDEKRPEPPPVKPPKANPTKVEVTKFTPPIIVKDDDVKEPIPVVDKLEDTRIGLVNQNGVKDESYVAPPVEVQSTGIEALKKPEKDYETIFIKVEKEAKFPGGMEGWRRYLERNLNANVASEDGAPVGNYTVKVQFIVDKEGGISNVEAIEVPKACPSCGTEAIKVIQKGPKWEPAIQNDRKVIYQAVQYVTFQVAEE